MRRKKCFRIISIKSYKMDNIVLAIQTVLQAALGATYEVIYGDDLPAKSEFPYVGIVPVSTEYRRVGTGGLSSSASTVKIIAKVQINDYMQDDNNTTKQEYLQTLVKIMEERDATMILKSTTVLGGLYNDLSLGGVVSTMEVGTINYDTAYDNGSYIRTAELTITAIQTLPFCTT